MPVLPPPAVLLASVLTPLAVLEPVGAMRKLLESHEAKGDFEIYDEQLKQQFWKYYLKDPISWKVLPPDKVDYSEPW